jgi:hypothetical protein
MMADVHAGQTPSQEYGYLLYPPRRPSEPGHSGLEVYLRQQPSQHHFDPDQVHLLAATSEGGLETMKISHPWMGVNQWRACAGQVDLLDRKGKHVDLFTFGGELQVDKIDDHSTQVILKSEAPILLSQSHTSSINLFIQEVEILLAQSRAEWCRERESFDHCLACLEPFDLYRMCLAAISERFRQLPHRDEATAKLFHILQNEIAVVGFSPITLADLRA